jgi:endonuclease III
MQSICVKVDDDVYQELEKRRGTETKSVYYRKIIDAYLSLNEYRNIQRVYDELKIEYDKILAIQDIQKARIEDLQKTNGFYLQEIESWKRLSEKVLYPSQEEQKEKGKKWFEFWK